MPGCESWEFGGPNTADNTRRRLLLRVGGVCVGGVADGFDEFLVEHGVAPGLDSGLLEGVVVGVRPVAPEVALEVVSEVLDRIEFGAVGRQPHQRYVLRHGQGLGRVEPGPIPYHHLVLSRGDRLGE